MRWLQAKLASQRGAAWTLALVLLAMGSLLAGPAVTHISGSLAATNKLDQRILDRYASDAGVEHALWRVQYEAGFQASLNPTVNYTQSYNGRTASVTVTAADPPNPPPAAPPPQQSGVYLGVSSRVEPNSASPGQSTTLTYTLYLDNYGTSAVHLEEIRDLLPAGFTYVPGSASSTGLTFSGGNFLGDPDVGDVGGQPQLEWDFNTPRPTISAGERATVTFQVTGTPSYTGTYGNQVWVEASPNSIGTVSTGSTSPVSVQWPQFDLTSTAGSSIVRVRAEKPPNGMVIRSWQVQ